MIRNILRMEGLGLLIGVDCFMSEGRAITNLIGNGIATIVVAKGEKEFDEKKSIKAIKDLRKVNTAV